MFQFAALPACQEVGQSKHTLFAGVQTTVHRVLPAEGAERRHDRGRRRFPNDLDLIDDTEPPGNVTLHTAQNRGAANVDFWATYIVPGAPGSPFRIDSPNPSRCNF
jgi:hypothetical protein